MNRRMFLGSAAGGLAACAGVAACASGRIQHRAWTPGTLTAAEQADTIAGLRPPKRARPVVAIVADNRGSETTDLMIPYGVLKRSGLADVSVVAPDPSPIALMPALSIRPQATLEAFDRDHPGGADYVIVPAFHHDDPDGPIQAWLRRQAALRATVIGICEGVKIVGRAGLLDGRSATTHWYAVGSLQRTHPTMRWVRDRRYVVDRGVATTTGVSASLPMSLALVEAIGGRAIAAKLATQLGVASYDAAHRSDDFHLNAHWAWQMAANTIAVWSHEVIGISVADGVDDIALALTADAWSRTYRSKAVAIGANDTVTTRDGLTLFTSQKPGRPAPDFLLSLPERIVAAQALDQALGGIATRYGEGTAGFVALQLEYTWPKADRNKAG